MKKKHSSHLCLFFYFQFVFLLVLLSTQTIKNVLTLAIQPMLEKAHSPAVLLISLCYFFCWPLAEWNILSKFSYTFFLVYLQFFSILSSLLLLLLRLIACLIDWSCSLALHFYGFSIIQYYFILSNFIYIDFEWACHYPNVFTVRYQLQTLLVLFNTLTFSTGIYAGRICILCILYPE